MKNDIRPYTHVITAMLLKIIKYRISNDGDIACGTKFDVILYIGGIEILVYQL